MLIWALFAVMTAVAVAIVLVPGLRRRPAVAGDVDAGEVSVYRDQLAEVDRDLEAGLVGAAEADAARAEISRRILRTTRHGGAAGATTSGSRLLPILAAVAVPLVAAGLYARLGHPSLPDMPLAARTAPEPGGQSVEQLVARVEARLAADPSDTKGWEALAPVYRHLGRYDLAAAAWRNAIRTGGPTERRLNELGQVLIIAADDVITPEARAVFEKSLEVEPTGILPRFVLAAALGQEGKKAEAVSAWKAIVALGRGDEPWLADAREELARAEADLAGKPFEPSVAPPSSPSTPPAESGAAAPGPSAADIQAAGKMSPEERAKMIDEMVSRAQERLMTAGGSIEQWERLIRSQLMLGRTADAEAALAKARADFAGNAEAIARLDALTAPPRP